MNESFFTDSFVSNQVLYPINNKFACHTLRDALRLCRPELHCIIEKKWPNKRASAKNRIVTNHLTAKSVELLNTTQLALYWL